MGSELQRDGLNEAVADLPAAQAGGPAASGTITTSQGPISWSLGANGTVTATGNGQQVVLTNAQTTQGVVQRQVVFSQLGQGPYLTTQSTEDDIHGAVSLSLAAGSSQLTIGMTGIDLAVTSGTATVTGSWAGSTVNWTGPVDLAANPLVETLIPGWPPGAFSDQLAAAAYFDPLTTVQAASSPESAPSSPPPGGQPGEQAKGLFRSVIKGLIVAGITVVGAAALSNPVTAGGLIVAGLTGFDASMWGDVVDQWPSGTKPTPPPVPDWPETETTTTHASSVAQDDPPPPPPTPPPPTPPPDDGATLGVWSSEDGGSGGGSNIGDESGNPEKPF